MAVLGTDYIDVLTLYYVEHAAEWEEITAPGGALRYLQDAKRDGTVRRIGITSHQRTLAAQMAKTGLLDAGMIRYNAAHRGAEREVLPVTQSLGLPVIAYTALRCGALLLESQQCSAPIDPMHETPSTTFCFKATSRACLSRLSNSSCRIGIAPPV